ncbi:thioredoxin reductase [Halosegnis sp.]|uniref:thioredoxin reductase n=1 Tax=Halosegnis sp. TaxID=2864959 RepID=UPI0035D500F3
MDAEVTVGGGGPAGLTAATFTAPAGLKTAVVSDGESILARNAHLENMPAFPLGVNAPTFLELCREGATEAGARLRDAPVTDTAATDGGFRIVTADGDAWMTRRLVAASWIDVSYLTDVDGLGLTARGSKTYVDVDEYGRTGVDGLYAAGRIAEKPHQPVVCAGHGAEVSLAVITDSDRPHYHDWVAPEGYFTGRGREVLPGCEEIAEPERRERERAAAERMRAAFADPAAAPPTMHPSVEATQDEEASDPIPDDDPDARNA